jgi:hypothetical protein
MPSISRTPGMIGKFGKWPWKKGSLMVTLLMPVAELSPSISTMRSIIRNG